MTRRCLPRRAAPVPKKDELTEALAALNPDERSPRVALEALYALSSSGGMTAGRMIHAAVLNREPR